MFARLLAEAVLRTEDASGGQVLLLARHASENASSVAGGCPQSVESAVLRAFEDASRTGGGLFEHRVSIPYRRGPFPVPSAVEGAREGAAGANKESGGSFAH